MKQPQMRQYNQYRHRLIKLVEKLNLSDQKRGFS